MKYKPFITKSKMWKKICFGINYIFTICLYRKGFTIDICYFGTIHKKVTYNYGIRHNQKTKY